jgi:multiple sugar transport system permease protein
MNYYSALTTIPAEQYEAACVDGANSVQRFFRVTLPNLKTITASTLIVLTVWTFLVFDIIYGMTGGGPVDATKTIPMRIYQEMFGMKNLGTASAWSLIAIAVLVTITIIYWKISDKEDA